MAERCRKFSFSEKSPQFFKVYLPTHCYQQLRIPPEFIKYFNGVLPYKSTIICPAKRSWQVDAHMVDDNFYFHKGWQQFVQDNSLEFGDFLVFYYGGNANFLVKIFGKNGCQKATDPITREADREFAFPQENQTVEHRRSKRLVREANSKEKTEENLHPRVPMAIQQDNRALEEAADKFKSKFPFFKVVITPSYVYNGVLNIPMSFLKSYMKKGRKSVTLQVSGKSWPVKLVRGKGNICKFARGWLTFSREYTLKAGDICVFELIDRHDYVLKVSFSRC